MNKYESIDAKELFVDLTNQEIDAVLFVYNHWIESMLICQDEDLLFDHSLFVYRVKSILSRHDFVTAMLNTITDITYEPNDIMLSNDNMILVISDIIYVLEANLDIVLNIAYEADVDEPNQFYEAYYLAQIALHKLTKLFG